MVFGLDPPQRCELRDQMPANRLLASDTVTSDEENSGAAYPPTGWMSVQASRFRPFP